MANQKISVVIPVYNSENTLVELTDRLAAVFSKGIEDYEIIFIDDCSSDNSWDILQKISRKNNNIRIIHLQRNFGQHNATLCGFHFAKGDYIVIMDDDLQHPPEEIPVLLNKIKEGYDVVYGRYIQKQHSRTENFFSHIFEKLMHNILKIPDSVYLSSFAIFSRDVIKNACTFKGSYIFLAAVISESTSMDNVTDVEVIHNPRKKGQSNYSFLKYIKLSLNLIINHSVLPLTLISSLGFITSILSILYGISVIIRSLTDPSFGIIGWSSLMVAVSFLSGMILLSLGIIGEYLRRVLVEVSYGQQYVIGEKYL
ncbi:glycosyltransferase family 2 protein [Methanogenium organophilum]|uniref:Glycosyltransferase family 2 protein n=1 Tax=Methanogenium organophilum TaxID=2199 RepID=A0A9X9S3R3_METOG|nr:glycosyltransferase family 2 protein [Methanogenium organophilum]WAI01202.1 glycosyltransferase family 2 protein [Methanogenium organophilum]